MTVNDVDLVVPAVAPGFITDPSVAPRRLTLQNFLISPILVTPHNSDARISDSDLWPPPLLFDVAYGCAALNTWGVRPFVDFAREHTWSIYYDDKHGNDDRDDENDDENGNGGGGDRGEGGSGSLNNLKTSHRRHFLGHVTRHDFSSCVAYVLRM